MFLPITTNYQSVQFDDSRWAWLRLMTAGAVLACTMLVSSGAPASAIAQPLADDANGQVMTTGSSLIMTSSPTGSNLIVDRVGRTVSGYVWSTDLGWVNFSAGLTVGNDGRVSGLTSNAGGAPVFDFNATPHNASVTINANNQLEGYAWSQDLGWIHFDGAGNAKALTTNAPLDINQQPMRANVTIDNLTGQMAGFAWNRDLGWLDFSGVKVELDGRLTGQATVKNSNNKLHFDSATYHSNVQVAQNGQFSGYAWNEDLGWVSFSGIHTKNGKFPRASVPSAVRNLTAVPIPSSTPGRGALRLTWQPPADDGGLPIASYHIEICQAEPTGQCKPGYDYQPYNPGLPEALTSFDITVNDNTYYNIRMTARNSVGLGPYSNVVTVRPSYISLRTVTNQVQLSITPTTNQNFSSSSHNVKVDSNLPGGLDLKLSTATANNHLSTIGGQTIAPTTGNFTNPQAIADNSWGYRINGGAFGFNTIIETNTNGSNFTWASVPPSATPDVIFTSNSLVSDQTIPVFYGVKVSNTQAPGNYSVTVIYEAVGR